MEISHRDALSLLCLFYQKGAPLPLARLVDDVQLGKDVERNNNFDFNTPGESPALSSLPKQIP
jgi:hypothetical protein